MGLYYVTNYHSGGQGTPAFGSPGVLPCNLEKYSGFAKSFLKDIALKRYEKGK